MHLWRREDSADEEGEEKGGRLLSCFLAEAQTTAAFLTDGVESFLRARLDQAEQKKLALAASSLKQALAFYPKLEKALQAEAASKQAAAAQAAAVDVENALDF